MVAAFTNFMSGVEALREWLPTNHINSDAMKSTGNYSVTLYDNSSAAGMEVFLVNARHVMGVPVRKADAFEAHWLQQLYSTGLVKSPSVPIWKVCRCDRGKISG
jgi:transposase